MLLRHDKYSFLPELLDEVGEELMTRLLDVFAGATIEFPSIKRLERYSREVCIYDRLNKTSKVSRSTVVNNLSDEYEIDNDTVWMIYHKIASLVEKSFGVKKTHR
jgi:hypothetical protein